MQSWHETKTKMINFDDFSLRKIKFQIVDDEEKKPCGCYWKRKAYVWTFFSLFDNEECLKSEKQVQGRRRVQCCYCQLEGKMSDVLRSFSMIRILHIITLLLKPLKASFLTHFTAQKTIEFWSTLNTRLIHKPRY